MKKILSIISILFLILCFSSCKKISNEQKLFEEFINSKSINFTIDFTKHKATSTDAETRYTATFNKNENGFWFSTVDGNYQIINDIKNNYLLLNINNEKRYYTKSSTFLKENIDYSNYFTKIVYAPNTIYAFFDLYNYLKALNPNLITEMISEETGLLDIQINIENNKISEFIINLTKLKKLFFDEYFTIDLYANINDIKYAGANQLQYELFLYDQVDADSFSKEITKIYNSVDSIVLGKKYSIYIENNYIVEPGSNFKLKGYLNDLETHIQSDINSYKHEISFNPQLDLENYGTTKYDINIKFDNGYSFEKSIAITIPQTVDEYETIDFNTSGICEMYLVQDYLIVADSSKLYKYDFNTKKILNSIEIGAEANSVYYKDGFLYVTAHNEMLVNYNYVYTGNITKINFDSFTIELQVEVECYPYSIIIDNNGDTYISKGADQSIYYSKIDLETGVMTNFRSGRERDYLLYDSFNGAIHVLTQYTTEENLVYTYQLGDYSIYPSTSYIETEWECYVNEDGTEIVSNYHGGVSYAYYNTVSNRYVAINRVITNSEGDYFSSFFANNGVAYKAEVDWMKNVTLGVYDFNNWKEKIIYFDFSYDSISSIVVFDNNLYVSNKDTGLVYVYNIE